jgi:hypothetical protein
MEVDEHNNRPFRFAYDVLSAGMNVPDGASIIAIIDADGHRVVAPVTEELLDEPDSDDDTARYVKDMLVGRRLSKGRALANG